MLSPVGKRIQRLTRVNALLIAILHFNTEHESLNPTSLKYRRGKTTFSLFAVDKRIFTNRQSKYVRHFLNSASRVAGRSSRQALCGHLCERSPVRNVVKRRNLELPKDLLFSPLLNFTKCLQPPLKSSHFPDLRNYIGRIFQQTAGAFQKFVNRKKNVDKTEKDLYKF